MYSAISVAARSKLWVCGRSLAGIAGSNSAGCIDVLSIVSVVCCEVEVSADDIWILRTGSNAEWRKL
jgi:hypothetical protein